MKGGVELIRHPSIGVLGKERARVVPSNSVLYDLYRGISRFLSRPFTRQLSLSRGTLPDHVYPWWPVVACCLAHPIDSLRSSHTPIGRMPMAPYMALEADDAALVLAGLRMVDGGKPGTATRGC